MKPGIFTAGGWLYVADRSTISDVIARQQAAGFGFRNPLYRAALVGELRLAELMPGGTIPASMLAPEARPTLIVVGDDTAPLAPSSGPAAFPQARRLVGWCKAVLLHSTGGKEEHYELATAWTRTLRRVVLVETSTAREAEWCDFLDAEAERRDRAGLPKLQGLRITCYPGGPHPANGGNT